MTDYILTHHGIKGMKWGVRRFQKQNGALTSAGKKRYADALDGTNIKNNMKSASKSIKKGINKAKKEIKKRSQGELANRGKSAIDVLMNGDKDWMGNSINSDDITVEVRNRGKAALERLMYSQEQIDNKKFFGSYNPFD